MMKKRTYLSYDATHDGMTALYNKGKYLYDISQLKAKNETVGIIVCDVNNLKQINDTLGHMVGDAIIRTIADTLKFIEDENNRCYRIGGDEFVVLQRDGDERSLKKVALVVNEQIDKSSQHYTVACSWVECLFTRGNI